MAFGTYWTMADQMGTSPWWNIWSTTTNHRSSPSKPSISEYSNDGERNAPTRSKDHRSTGGFNSFLTCRSVSRRVCCGPVACSCRLDTSSRSPWFSWCSCKRTARSGRSSLDHRTCPSPSRDWMPRPTPTPQWRRVFPDNRLEGWMFNFLAFIGKSMVLFLFYLHAFD